MLPDIGRTIPDLSPVAYVERIARAFVSRKQVRRHAPSGTASVYGNGIVGSAAAAPDTGIPVGDNAPSMYSQGVAVRRLPDVQRVVFQIPGAAVDQDNGLVFNDVGVGLCMDGTDGRWLPLGQGLELTTSRWCVSWADEWRLPVPSARPRRRYPA